MPTRAQLSVCNHLTAKMISYSHCSGMPSRLGSLEGPEVLTLLDILMATLNGIRIPHDTYACTPAYVILKDLRTISPFVL